MLLDHRLLVAGPGCLQERASDDPGHRITLLGDWARPSGWVALGRRPGHCRVTRDGKDTLRDARRGGQWQVPVPASRERVTRYGHEPPVVRAGAKGELEHAVRGRAAGDAVRPDRHERRRAAPPVPTTNSRMPAAARRPVAGLGREPLVVVVVPVELDIRAGGVEGRPACPRRRRVAVLAGAENRGWCQYRERRTPWDEPRGRRRATLSCGEPASAADGVAVGVQVVDPPACRGRRRTSRARRVRPATRSTRSTGPRRRCCTRGCRARARSGRASGPTSGRSSREELRGRAGRVRHVARHEHTPRDPVESRSRRGVRGQAAGA